MAEKLAESESNKIEKKMELLDLTDDALIHIFTYLDHRSQLNAMLVCRRFELLIGQNAQFYSNYKLRLRRQDNRLRNGEFDRQTRSGKKNATFFYFGRYFGEVCLDDYCFSPGSKYFPLLIQTMEIIGPKIIKLKIQKSEGYKMPFLDLLQHVNNVRELCIQDVQLKSFPISIKYKEVDLQQFTFPNLRSLQLDSIVNFELIEEVFYPVASLQHLKLAKIDQKDWESIQKFLMRQEDLRSLELNQVVVDNFEWRNCNNIEKLVMCDVRFPRKEAFQSFTDFIKTLSSIQELRLDVTRDERENQNNYTEILTHLLKLPSLRVLELKCANELNLRIQNAAEITFIAGYSNTRITTAARIFPNIQRVEFKRWTLNFEDLRALNLLNSLTELNFESISVNQLELIKCPQLQKFSANPDFSYSPFWKEFCENNSNIEFLELYNQISLTAPLEYLPKLKTFKLLNYRFDRSELNEKTLILFREKFIKGNLENLEIDFYYENPVAIVAFFKSNFPQLACDYRKLRNDRWLITITKH